jgi:hypothetical protein
MLPNKIFNWFVLTVGILMLAVVCLSIFTPWWRLQIGSGTTFATINADPFYTNFGVLGLNFVIPIIFAINIGTMALFTISGALLILYSIKPTKSYSKQLLCYAYKRPIYTFVGFIVTLLVVSYALPIVVNKVGGVNLSVPLFQLVGTSIIQLPAHLSGSSIQIGVTVVTAFQYTFYLGVIATALAIVARIYYRKTVPNTVLPDPVAASPPTPDSTPTPTSPPRL